MPLYQQEEIEEVKILEMGFNVKVVVDENKYSQHTVDGTQDIAAVEKLIRMTL